MSFTPFNAPLLAGLLGDREIAAFFSVEADLKAALRFEVGLARAQANSGLVSSEAAKIIEEKLSDFEPDIAELSLASARDGPAVPALIKQMRAAIGDPHASELHKGTTSQDVIDTSLMLRLKSVFNLFGTRMSTILAALDQLSETHGGTSLMARTRMQRALPISAAHKIAMWRHPLADLQSKLPTDFPLQLGGPEGALAAMGDHPEKIAQSLAKELGLNAPETHWQTDRRPLLNLCIWANSVTTALGKIGADVSIMAQNEIGEVKLKGGGSSSAMPHKNNPVLAESLVTLARFNAAQMAGMHQAALHENERSGAAWSLEWMLVPQLMVATGAALRNADNLLKNIEFPAT